MRPKKRKLGLSFKLFFVCILLAFLCMAGELYVLKLDPRPSWAADVQRTFKIGSWMFLVLGTLLKGAISMFDRPE